MKLLGVEAGAKTISAVVAAVVAIVGATLAVDHTYLRQAVAAELREQDQASTALVITNIEIERITDQLERLALTEERLNSQGQNLPPYDVRRRELLVQQLGVLYQRQTKLLERAGE